MGQGLVRSKAIRTTNGSTILSSLPETCFGRSRNFRCVCATGECSGRLSRPAWKHLKAPQRRGCPRSWVRTQKRNFSRSGGPPDSGEISLRASPLGRDRTEVVWRILANCWAPRFSISEFQNRSWKRTSNILDADTGWLKLFLEFQTKRGGWREQDETITDTNKQISYSVKSNPMLVQPNTLTH